MKTMMNEQSTIISVLISLTVLSLERAGIITEKAMNNWYVTVKAFFPQSLINLSSKEASTTLKVQN